MTAPKPDVPVHTNGPARNQGATARLRVTVALMAGVAAGLVAGFTAKWVLAPLVAWDVAVVVFIGWVWLSVRHLDAPATARMAVREDPSRAAADAILLVASVASLGAVGVVLITSGQGSALGQGLQVALGALSVVLSWALVHTIFMLRYARLYYADEDGGIDFNQKQPPSYADFAYLAFTIGMTFQVSDTSIKDAAIRRTALHQALLSYLFGTVIVATTINLVVGITKG